MDISVIQKKKYKSQIKLLQGIMVFNIGYSVSV